MEVINFIIEKPGENKVKMAFDLADTSKDILTKACEKYNVLPEDYELRFGKKLLGEDVGVSELPPEAELELHCHPSHRSVLVHLSIGNSVSSKRFKSSASLWNVSQELLPKDRFIEDDRIKITYYGKSVVGLENLQKIQLSSLCQDGGKLKLKLDRSYSDTELPNSEQQRPGSTQHSKLMKLFKPEAEANEEHKNSLHASIGKKKNMPTYRLSASVKALTDIDRNIYKNSKEKLKGIVQLDKRKGLMYNMKNLPKLGKVGSDLLGLTHDNNPSFGGREREIPMKVVFPDQSVIQATFDGEETLADLYNFIGLILKCPISEITLYKKEDKQDLDPTIQLKDISTSPEHTLYLYSPQDINAAFPSSKDIFGPKTEVKLKPPTKRWSISSKKN